MSAWDGTVDRAIEYTSRVLRTMPGYRAQAIHGLTRLRDRLAKRTPDDAAVARLTAYLETLRRGSP